MFDSSTWSTSSTIYISADFLLIESRLFFKIEFLEIIKRDRKKIATKREREYISATKLSMFLKASIIRIEIIIAAIT